MESVGLTNLAMQFATEKATDIQPSRAAMFVPCITIVTVASHIKPKVILAIHVVAARHVIAIV